MSALDNVVRRLTSSCGHVKLPPLVCDECRATAIKSALAAWPIEVTAASKLVSREDKIRMENELVKAKADLSQAMVQHAAFTDKIRKMEDRYVQMSRENITLRDEVSNLKAQLHAETAAEVYRKLGVKRAEA